MSGAPFSAATPNPASRRARYSFSSSSMPSGVELKCTASRTCRPHSIRRRRKRSEVLERAAPCNLVDVAGIAHAVLFCKLVEVGLRLMHDDAGGARCLTLRNPALLEQRDVHASRGENIRSRASHGSAADNGDVGVEGPTVARIGWTARSGKPIEPIDSPVVCFGQGAEHSMTKAPRLWRRAISKG